jgi:hypothetical protein
VPVACRGVVDDFSVSPDIRVPCRRRGGSGGGAERQRRVGMSSGGAGMVAVSSGVERQCRVGTSGGGGAGRDQGAAGFDFE